MAEIDLATSLRSIDELLDGPPSRASWLQICALVEALGAQDVDRCIESIAARAQTWPARVRMAPMLWINRLVDGLLPYRALELVSSLSLTAALYGPRSPEHSTAMALPGMRYRSAVLAWLEKMPAQVRPLEGVSLSFRSAHLQAIERAVGCESDARVHPGPMVKWRHDHLREPLLAAVLEAPICRALRVFDVSVDAKFSDDVYVPDVRGSAPNMDLIEERCEWAMQGGCSLGEVVSRLPSGHLESLDLHGVAHGDGHLFQQMPEKLGKSLKRLRYLNVGGGIPLAMTEVERFGPLLRQSSLEALHLAFDVSIFDALESPTEFWKDRHKFYRESYDEDPRALSAILKKWCKGANSLRHLVLRDRLARDDAFTMPDPGRVAVELRGPYTSNWLAPFPSDWTEHFEL